MRYDKLHLLLSIIYAILFVLSLLYHMILSNGYSGSTRSIASIIYKDTRIIIMISSVFSIMVGFATVIAVYKQMASTNICKMVIMPLCICIIYACTVSIICIITVYIHNTALPHMWLVYASLLSRSFSEPLAVLSFWHLRCFLFQYSGI